MLAIAFLVLGFAAAITGIALLSVPAALIACGVVTATVAVLFVDFDRKDARR